MCTAPQTGQVAVPRELTEVPVGSQVDPARLSERIDTSVAHPARRYDYWLGGKDNFAADRESGDAIATAFPAVRVAAMENRRFLRRAVTFLAQEAGIRQFLDIGTGIPAANNTHEVAQAIAPESRIVYVDNDHSKSGCAHTGLTWSGQAVGRVWPSVNDSGGIWVSPSRAARPAHGSPRSEHARRAS
jgi:hypothetical protein